MRWVRICGGSGERNRKGGYRGHLMGCPIYGMAGIRGEAGAAIQPTVAENRG